MQFSPPLVRQVGGRDDEGPLDQATELQFLDGQPTHDRLARPWVVRDEEPDAGLGEQVRVDRIHLVRQRIDLRHRDGEVRVILEGQPDAVGFGGEAEVRGIAVQGRKPPCLRDLDGAVELFGLEEFRPETLAVQADRLDLDTAAASLGGQHLDRLGPVRTFQGGPFCQVLQDFLWIHGASALIVLGHADRFVVQPAVLTA